MEFIEPTLMRLKNGHTSRRLTGSYIVSLTSIVLVLLMTGAFVSVSMFANNLAEYIKENISFEIVFRKNATEAQILRVKSYLEERDFVRSVEYVTQDEATRRLNESLGEDFTQWLGDVENPLLPSLEVKFESEYANSDSLAVIEKWAKDRGGVGEVHYQRELVESVNHNINRIIDMMAVLCVIFFAIAIILLSHTIRLSIYAKRFAVRTMLLVGATRSFVRKPFVKSFFTQGLVGSCIALIIITIALLIVFHRIPNLKDLSDTASLFWLYAGILIGGCAITSTCAFLSVNRYIDTDLDELYA